MNASAKRRTVALSLEQIVTAAIDILDNEGEKGLTLRVLARRLSTGAGALYYHVANKEELLALATDAVISKFLSPSHSQSEPLESLRDVAISLWEAGEAHPWAAMRLLIDPNRISVARIYEAIGSRLTLLNIPEQDQFNICSALCSYIAGNISQQASNIQTARSLANLGYTREEYLGQLTDTWRQFNKEEFPFVFQIIDQFPTHDDRQQYIAGIDLILSGISKSYAC